MFLFDEFRDISLQNSANKQQYTFLRPPENRAQKKNEKLCKNLGKLC